MEEKPSTSKKMTEEYAESSLGTPHSSVSPYSVQSRLNVAAAAPEMPKPALGKPEAKTEEKKKRKKRGTSRVEKRKKPPTRRQVIRRAPRRKPRTRVEKRRDLSVSTIYTRLSSSGMLTPGCERCGHRCCRRRFEMDLRRYIKRYYKRYRPKRKRPLYKTARCISESVQVGSRTKMLSPLFVNQNSTPPPTKFDTSILYSAITPEMIHEALRNLTMWKQCVMAESIVDFMLRNYPVNTDKEALAIELLEKLQVAAAVGIICQLAPGTWSLSCALQKRKISKTHVTLFWKLYGDTMRPIDKNEHTNAANQNVNNMTQAFHFYDSEIV